MVKIGSETEVNDIILTRYACYNSAKNGKPNIEQIAFDQNYFVVQIKKYELIEKQIKSESKTLGKKPDKL